MFETEFWCGSQWWLLDAFAGPKSSFFLTSVQDINQDTLSRQIHLNFLKLQDENKTLRYLAVRFRLFFTQTSSLRRVKYMDALRITRLEHSTLEVDLSYWIRWSVPLFCIQLTSLSCPVVNRKLGLLSNAYALTT